MFTLEQLSKLKHICQNHLTDLEAEDKTELFSIIRDDYEIWGGLGDRDEIDHYLITKDGWVESHITRETGLYQKSDRGIVQQNDFKLNDNAFLKIINNLDDNYILETFNKFYQYIYNQYRSDF